MRIGQMPEVVTIDARKGRLHSAFGRAPGLLSANLRHALRFRRPMRESRNSLSTKTVTENKESVLPSCLPESEESDADLAAVVEAWAELPSAIRAGIMAMIEATRD